MLRGRLLGSGGLKNEKMDYENIRYIFVEGTKVEIIDVHDNQEEISNVKSFDIQDLSEIGFVNMSVSFYPLAEVPTMEIYFFDTKANLEITRSLFGSKGVKLSPSP